jgi:hypothetical protein
MAPERPVVQPRCRDVGDPREARREHLVEQQARVAERVGGADPPQDRRIAHGIEDLAAQLEGHGIAVAVREVTGQRPVTGHPERAGVVDHDQVDAAALGGLGDEPDPGAADDDRAPIVDGRRRARTSGGRTGASWGLRVRGSAPGGDASRAGRTHGIIDDRSSASGMTMSRPHRHELEDEPHLVRSRGVVATVVPLVDGLADRELFVLPPFPALWVARQELAGTAIGWGAQDLHPQDRGAHTGDVSAEMLVDLGCTYVEMGHSERRSAMAGDSLSAARCARASARD